MIPSLSIVIPTYNRPALLQRAVTSALIACPLDGEVIVVDDQSDTAETALAAMAQDARLKITTNTGDKGAAGARNSGVAAARSEIVLFLDDDDTLAKDYPARVVYAAQASDVAFGFSTVMVHEAGKNGLMTRRELAAGIVGADVPLEHKTAAFSAGFWIRRGLVAGAGGIDPAQTVDEDTDLCCRLYGLGYLAWFEEEPGCIVHRGYEAVDGSAPQLTRSTAGNVEAQCYARTFRRNAAAYGQYSADRWFMLRRALRMAARTGADDVACGLLQGLQPFHWRIKGWLYWQMKRAGARLR